MNYFSNKVLHITAALLLAASASVSATTSASTSTTASSMTQTSTTNYAQLDQAGHTLIVKISIQTGKTDAFLRLMKARMQQSRADAAVVDFRFFTSADPQVFYGVESFRSKDAFAVFAQSPESKTFAEALKSMLDKPLEAQFLQPLP